MIDGKSIYDNSFETTSTNSSNQNNQNSTQLFGVPKKKSIKEKVWERKQKLKNRRLDEESIQLPNSNMPVPKFTITIDKPKSKMKKTIAKVKKQPTNSNDEKSNLSKKELQRIRNRQSAEKSRAKKKEEMETLKEENLKLIQEVEFKDQQIQNFILQIEELQKIKEDYIYYRDAIFRLPENMKIQFDLLYQQAKDNPANYDNFSHQIQDENDNENYWQNPQLNDYINERNSFRKDEISYDPSIGEYNQDSPLLLPLDEQDHHSLQSPSIFKKSMIFGLGIIGLISVLLVIYLVQGYSIDESFTPRVLSEGNDALTIFENENRDVMAPFGKCQESRNMEEKLEPDRVPMFEASEHMKIRSKNSPLLKNKQLSNQSVVRKDTSKTYPSTELQLSHQDIKKCFHIDNSFLSGPNALSSYIIENTDNHFFDSDTTEQSQYCQLFIPKGFVKETNFSQEDPTQLDLLDTPMKEYQLNIDPDEFPIPVTPIIQCQE